MKYEPEREIEVFSVVKELGEASTDEVHDYFTNQLKVDIEKKILIRYLRRWHKKKVFALGYLDGQPLWKLAGIPPWYVSGMMSIVKGSTNEEMRLAIEALNEKLKGQGRIIQPRGVWGGYEAVDLTFETVDPILGGRLSDEEGELVITNYNGHRFIPANWFKGWLRSNAALHDLPQSICYHIQVSNADLPEFEPESVRLKVKMGLCTYEAIPPKTQFKVRWRFPMRGSKFKSMKEWKAYLSDIAEHPLRGLGANPYALGGRIRLIEPS